MNQNSSFGVLLMMAVIAVVFLLYLNKDSFGSIIGKFSNGGSRKGKDGYGDRPGSDGSDGKTEIPGSDVPKLVIEQLSMKTGKVVHRYSIEELPDLGDGIRGLYISRPTAKEGDIFLDPVCPEAKTVSECHLFIGEDEQGLYVADNDSRGGTFINGNSKRIAGTAITNGLILMLCRQPIRFVIPAAPKQQWFREFDPSEADMKPEQPARGAPRFRRRVR